MDTHAAGKPAILAHHRGVALARLQATNQSACSVTLLNTVSHLPKTSQVQIREIGHSKLSDKVWFDS